MTINSADFYIQQYKLEPHPEGGYFGLVYKSDDQVKPLDARRYNDQTRSAGTSIYYLLEKEQFSAWHVLKSDEIWHFYDGSAVKIHVINKDTGKLTTHILGRATQNSAFKPEFQVVIKAGDYFAAEVEDKSSFSLVGCTVHPGFEYKDFRLVSQRVLKYRFPQHTAIIERLCHVNAQQFGEGQADSLSAGSSFGYNSCILL